MSAEAMKIAQGDMNQPDLRIGKALPEPVRRLHLILVQLVFARLDVDGDELIFVCWRQIGANFFLEERVAAAGEYLFAIAPFVSRHLLAPVVKARVLYRGD